MDENTKKLTIDLLRAWAETKQDVGEMILGGRGYTAAEYVDAVEKGTPLGQAYLAFMDAAAKHAKRPLEEFLKDSIRPQPRPQVNFNKLFG
ncbi:MAG TPA: hypothetical protein VEF76_06645 [Patescibacteria group bacterium]|nr:hypothetical protein [Patescibacteria group bacterium]